MKFKPYLNAHIGGVQTRTQTFVSRTPAIFGGFQGEDSYSRITQGGNDLSLSLRPAEMEAEDDGGDD